ncbi:hypothetical protein [Leifsonia aquatica]|uniref:hypothetical protein n=1 Tax=Leifsonia aquatica TaxID=144185 RepID=UPI001F067FF9|nr:hypothetical protein [Leifsonia aquatica]
MECVFVNGTVGVGKSTVADAISAAEAAPHAVIDLDAVRRMHPAPVEDVFNHELELRNLRSLAANYREAGARRLILAGVIESAAEVGRYAEAAGATALLVCRLVAAPTSANGGSAPGTTTTPRASPGICGGRGSSPPSWRAPRSRTWSSTRPTRRRRSSRVRSAPPPGGMPRSDRDG